MKNTENETAKSFNNSSSESTNTGFASDLINLVSLLTKSVFPQNTQFEDVNPIFKLLTKILEILISKCNIINKGVVILKVIRKS